MRNADYELIFKSVEVEALRFFNPQSEFRNPESKDVFS